MKSYTEEWLIHGLTSGDKYKRNRWAPDIKYEA